MSAGRYAQWAGGNPKRGSWKLKGWARGQNSFAEDNEIRNDEFFSGLNTELVGKSSVRMPRRGKREFSSIAGRTNFNGWGIYKNPTTGENFMLAMFDGHLYKITTDGTATEIDPSETWNTTAKMRGVLLRESFYFGNAEDFMAKTDGSTVTTWTSITALTDFGVTLSGTGATNVYAYTATAVTDVGETEAVTEVSLYGPATLDSSNKMVVTFDRKTEANIKGYNIYKAESGDTLTLLRFIDQPSTGATVTYNDDGVDERSLIAEAPDFNTTGGIKGNIFGTYANTLFIAGNLADPDTVFYGGTGSNFESFSPSDNGGWVKPGRGDGDRVTGMIGFEDFLFIFKENSIWKFVFGSDGGPSLSSVIPQYGTSSPDSIQRMEKDVIYFGTDGRYRILGYEPNQLNVIRTADISNRIQPDLDALDKGNLDNFFSVFFEQKYILCDKEFAYPYDRRYIAFLGKFDKYDFDRMIVWDKGTGKQLLFAAETGLGKISQILVDNTYDDDGDNISSSLRVKRIDAGEDNILKYFNWSKIKVKYPRGAIKLITYKDGINLVDQETVEFDIGGGWEDGMFDEFMFDEAAAVEEAPDPIQLLYKELYFEAYSIYHQILIEGNANNHAIVQTMTGLYEFEDLDYLRDEILVDED